MSLKDYSGSLKKEDCYRSEHGGSATLWVTTPERDWLFSYSHFLYIEWDLSDGVMIHFSTHQIKITGINLRPIVEALSNMSLAHVAMKHRHDLEPKDEGPLIFNIVVHGTER